MLSGTLRPGCDVGLARPGDIDFACDTTVNTLVALPSGDSLTECVAGDVCVVPGLVEARRADTVYGVDSPLRIATWSSAHDAQTDF